MVIIGVDPHKRDAHRERASSRGTNRTAASLQIDASLAGYRRLLRWAAQFGERRWAVENARGLGRHLAQWLARPRRAGRGCAVDRDRPGAGVVPRRSPQERRHRRSRGGERGCAGRRCHPDPGRGRRRLCWRCSTSGGTTSSRNAPGWSTSCTRCCATCFPAAPTRPDRRRRSSSCSPGCGRPGRSRSPASNSPATWSPRSAKLDQPAQDTDPPDAAAVAAEHGQPADRAWTALARWSPAGCSAASGRASRFPHRRRHSPATAGVAPVEVASADRARHRLPRGGDRQLNLALHIVALTQVRMRAQHRPRLLRHARSPPARPTTKPCDA